MTQLESLMITISLIDKTALGTQKIIGQIDDIESRVARGTANILKGSAGLLASGLALQKFIAPGREMARVLGEVAALDVNDDALRKLELSSLQFMSTFGESATEFVEASYDIQSAIAGLTGDELAGFTNASAILAKATKAQTNEITNFMGTMYGIFQNEANRIGRADWVNMLAGQTATAVRMFKTTGSEMNSAFAALGAEATNNGIALSEQLAILGKLQATMSGSEAATKYVSFLQGIGKAQAALGLQFTDSQGRMLSMVEILKTLKASFGAIDTVAESDILKKAFGRKEASSLIKLLMQDIGGLEGAIKDLSLINGISPAVTMAETQIDPWDKLGGSIKAVAIVFSRQLGTVLTPIVNRISDMTQTMMRWALMFPNLTKAIAVITFSVVAFAGVLASLAIIWGIMQLLGAGWAVITLGGALTTGLWTVATQAASKALVLLRAAILAASIHIAILRSAFLASAVATTLFNTALWANPLVWVIGLVVALVGGLTLLVVHWDKVKLSAMNSFEKLGKVWATFRDTIENNGFLRLAFTPLLVAIDGIQLLIKHANGLPAIFRRLKQSLSRLFDFGQPEYFSLLSDTWNKFRAKVEDNNFLHFAFTPLLFAVDSIDFVVQSVKKLPTLFASVNDLLSGIFTLKPSSFFDGLHLAWLNLQELFSNNTFLSVAFAPLTSAIGAITSLTIHLEALPNVIAKAWEELSEVISVNPFEKLNTYVDKAKQLFNGFSLGGFINNNNIISLGEREKQMVNNLALASESSSQVSSSGGMLKEIKSTITHNNGKTVKIDNLIIENSQPLDGRTFIDELAMAT